MYLEDHVPGEKGDLKEIILKLSECGKIIRSGFISRQGKSDTVNVYGETQVEMDKWTDQVLVDELSGLDCIETLSSEERPDVIKVHPEGGFSVVFDPLDGSSLMGVNLTVGTIVGIYESNTPLEPGARLAAALYILYGPLTTLTYTVGEGVHEFVLDADGRFRIQHEELMIGDSRIYAPGALRRKWLTPHLRWIERLEDEGYKIRFSGSFVADVHQILHKGGVFTYPGIVGKEGGKLRLLFEANPMGFIVTNAGGAASNGREDILQITPKRVDQRVPIYIGGRREIEMIEEEYAREE